MKKKLLFFLGVLLLPLAIYSQINYSAIDSLESDLYSFRPLTPKDVHVSRRKIAKLFEKNFTKDHTVIFCKIDSTYTLADPDQTDALVKNFYLAFKDTSIFFGVFVSSDFYYTKDTELVSSYMEFDYKSGELVVIEGKDLKRKYRLLTEKVNKLLNELPLQSSSYSEIYNR